MNWRRLLGRMQMYMNPVEWDLRQQGARQANEIHRLEYIMVLSRRALRAYEMLDNHVESCEECQETGGCAIGGSLSGDAVQARIAGLRMMEGEGN